MKISHSLALRLYYLCRSSGPESVISVFDLLKVQGNVNSVSQLLFALRAEPQLDSYHLQNLLHPPSRHASTLGGLPETDFTEGVETNSLGKFARISRRDALSV